MNEYMIVGGGSGWLRVSGNLVAITDFNAYAGFWGSIIMGDIQERILKVIKVRCEDAATGN